VTSHSGMFTETQRRASTAGRATTELCSRLNPTRLAVSVALPPTSDSKQAFTRLGRRTIDD
jgi:hypothetical protein